MPSVRDARIDAIPQKIDARGTLAVAEFSRFVPFKVVRIFYVFGVPPGTTRGRHAHKLCSQYMICQRGRVHMELSDGAETRGFELKAGNGMLIEPGIFASESYLDADTVLLALCDRPYEAEDYIHTMDEFLEYVRAAGGSR